jgi:hypothetical protein
VQVTNTTGSDLYLAAIQTVVADGDTIEVDDNLAEQLTLQGWRVKTAKRPTHKAEKATTEEN